MNICHENYEVVCFLVTDEKRMYTHFSDHNIGSENCVPAVDLISRLLIWRRSRFLISPIDVGLL